MDLFNVIVFLLVGGVVGSVAVYAASFDMRKRGGFADALARHGLRVSRRPGVLDRGVHGTFRDRIVHVRHVPRTRTSLSSFNPGLAHLPGRDPTRDTVTQEGHVDVVTRAATPGTLTLTVSPRGALDGVLGKLGAPDAGTGDAAFDAHHRVRVSDATRAAFILEPAVRKALADVPLVRLRVARGRVHLRLRERARADAGAVMTAVALAVDVAERVDASAR